MKHLAHLGFAQALFPGRRLNDFMDLLIKIAQWQVAMPFGVIVHKGVRGGSQADQVRSYLDGAARVRAVKIIPKVLLNASIHPSRQTADVFSPPVALKATVEGKGRPEQVGVEDRVFQGSDEPGMVDQL